MICRAEIAQGRVEPIPVVEYLDVVEDVGTRILTIDDDDATRRAHATG